MAVAVLMELEPSPRAKALIAGWSVPLIYSANAIASQEEVLSAKQLVQNLVQLANDHSRRPELYKLPPHEELFSQLLAILDMCKV